MNLWKTTIALGILILCSCTKPPDYPDEPVLEYVSMTKTQMMQGLDLNTDSLTVQIDFTDGDGDIAGENGPNVLVVNAETGDSAVVFKVPQIPNSNNKYGISGTIYLTIFTECCTPPFQISELCSPLPSYPQDTLLYEVSLIDQAGNISNKVSLEPIILLCE